MKITNTSTYPTDEVRRIVNFVNRDLGLPNDREISIERLRGRYFWRGTAWYRYCNVRIRPGMAEGLWQEKLVEGVAHELRHLHQRIHRPGEQTSREKERDCRAYQAWAVLRWREARGGAWFEEPQVAAAAGGGRG